MDRERKEMQKVPVNTEYQYQGQKTASDLKHVSSGRLGMYESPLCLQGSAAKESSARKETLPLGGNIRKNEKRKSVQGCGMPNERKSQVTSLVALQGTVHGSNDGRGKSKRGKGRVFPPKRRKNQPPHADVRPYVKLHKGQLNQQQRKGMDRS